MRASSVPPLPTGSPPSCACWMLHIGTGSDPSVLQECSLPYRQALAHFPHSRSPMTRDVHNTTPAGCWGRSGGWHPVLPCHCATGSTCRSRPLHQPRNASLSSQGLAPSLFVRHRPRRGDTRSPLPTTARHAHAPPPFSPPPNPLGAPPAHLPSQRRPPPPHRRCGHSRRRRGRGPTSRRCVHIPARARALPAIPACPA